MGIPEVEHEVRVEEDAARDAGDAEHDLQPDDLDHLHGKHHKAHEEIHERGSEHPPPALLLDAPEELPGVGMRVIDDFFGFLGCLVEHGSLRTDCAVVPQPFYYSANGRALSSIHKKRVTPSSVTAAWRGMSVLSRGSSLTACPA